MTSHTRAVDVRSALVTALQADLVGPFDPASGHELLPVPPSRSYLTGFLAPQGQRLDDPGDDDELAAGDDDASKPKKATKPKKPDDQGSLL
jgi:hypothetical protein